MWPRATSAERCAADDWSLCSTISTTLAPEALEGRRDQLRDVNALNRNGPVVHIIFDPLSRERAVAIAIPMAIAGKHSAHSLTLVHVPDVFILGSGFSRAISGEMPVTHQLPLVLHGGRGAPAWWPALERFSGNFEHLLSYLGQEQPWLSPARNATNQAQFLDLSARIAAVILERQNAAIRTLGTPHHWDAPPWLGDLLATWEERRVRVITFNYDTLVEKAHVYEANKRLVPTPQAMGESHNELLEAVSARGGTPSASELYAFWPEPLGSPQERPAEGPVKTFRLLKLHGSINWYYSGAQSFYGETLYGAPMRVGWWTDDAEEWHRSARGKVPLVVPPTTDKARFFANESVRAQWQEAAFDLADADSVFALGYSLPETDLLVKSLFSQEMSVDRAPVYVVNKNRGRSDLDDPRLVERFEEAFPRGDVYDTFVREDDDVMRDFVTAYVEGELPRT